MYSVSNGGFMLIKRCPLTQVTSISKYTYSNFMTRSARIATSFVDVKLNLKNDNRRNYVSVGERKGKNFNIPVNDIMQQSKQLLKDVKLSELHNAPLPAFWYGFGGLAPFVLPPLSFILFGYSPFLGAVQLTYGATILSFLGGIKWGHHVKENSSLTWESLGWAVIPQSIAWISLMMPQTLGFIMISGGLLVSGYCDLTMMKYPNWYRAMRLSLTIPAVISLLLTGLMCLFH
ncbi:transmembrane protein 69 [Halyomorpha halys]|uniref:transmembrane protein 69 n=1 Tax=Halyomorpha halys TaxID=286706 RepID=UPI0006D4D0A1|nr:transmembrane protein 69 [Halyomorpha halys]